MGYEIHITRKETWHYRASSNDISLDEWEEYVKSDDEMVLEEFIEIADSNGDIIRIEKQGLSVWNEHPNLLKIWFNWFGGKISVNNPDDETVGKMIKIAKILDAKIIGDEGKVFFG